MPRIDFGFWDRLYILKLICTAQMTYSSFIGLIYLYLIILQKWTSSESERLDVMTYKWSVIAVTCVEFGVGTLLAFVSNIRDARGRGLLAWLVIETFLIPISIFLIMQLHHMLTSSKTQYETDPHYSRINIAQVCFLLCQYICMGYVIDFLAYVKPKPKGYDPSIRPVTVSEPADPMITTTESRNIKMSLSFLSKPSSSKKVAWDDENDPQPSTSENKKHQHTSMTDLRSKWSRDEEDDWMEKDEREIHTEETNKK